MRRTLAFVLVGLVALAGCEQTPTPTSAPPSPTPVPTVTASATPTAAPAALPIVVGMFLPPFFPSLFYSMGNMSGFRSPGFRTDLPIQLVYNGLYRYDESIDPVPDLAAEPCDVSADGLTITCRLVEASFHDGTPMTADDVAFTYEVARRQEPDCEVAFLTCLGAMLDSATALDARTVEFKLKKPNATFITLALPQVMIESRKVIEAAYAPLGARAASLKGSVYTAAADRIDEQFNSEHPDCEGALKGVDELFAAAGIDAVSRDAFIDAEGQLDACAYGEIISAPLRAIGASVQATGLDALAKAYVALPFNRAPVGTGPFRFAGLTGGESATFTAFDGYHFGAPATPRIDIRIERDPETAVKRLQTGEFQWLTLPPRGSELLAAAQAQPGTKLATFPEAGSTMLMYNLRKGRLFADPNLRAAMELCINKPETVDTATHGQGQVVYSPVDPVSWAYQPDLVHPERNVAEARRLIEASGWAPAKDGVYARGGRRLATTIFVLGADAERVTFMDLVAAQVRECGIDLEVVPKSQQAVLAWLGRYPHIPGGQKQPFDAVFIGWGESFDPDDATWSSAEISSAKKPLGLNTMGFSDPKVDDLLERGRSTYDQRERARIYRELQDVLAADRPVLWGWALSTTDMLDQRITLTDGEPNLGSRMWMWQLEKVVLPGS